MRVAASLGLSVGNTSARSHPCPRRPAVGGIPIPPFRSVSRQRIRRHTGFAETADAHRFRPATEASFACSCAGPRGRRPRPSGTRAPTLWPASGACGPPEPGSEGPYPRQGRLETARGEKRGPRKRRGLQAIHRDHDPFRTHRQPLGRWSLRQILRVSPRASDGRSQNRRFGRNSAICGKSVRITTDSSRIIQ